MTFEQAISFSKKTTAADLKAQIAFLQKPENTAGHNRYVNIEGVILWLETKLKQNSPQ